jgi:hypothetical protein
MLTFSEALLALKCGSSVQRKGWNGGGQFLTLQQPDGFSKITLPYIYITTVQGDRVPWLASQTDLLAADWQIVVPVPNATEGISGATQGCSSDYAREVARKQEAAAKEAQVRRRDW